MAGFDTFFVLDDFEVQEVVIDIDGEGFCPCEELEGLNIQAFAIQHIGIVYPFAHLDFGLFAELHQAQAGKDMLIEVSFKIGKLAFAGTFQFAQQYFFIVVGLFFEYIEEVQEFKVALSLYPPGIEAEIPFFCLGQGTDQREEIVAVGDGHTLQDLKVHFAMRCSGRRKFSTK